MMPRGLRRNGFFSWILWIAAGLLASWVTARWGIAVGLAWIGLVSIAQFKPARLELASSNGRHVLIEYGWNFEKLLLLVSIACLARCCGAWLQLPAMVGPPRGILSLYFSALLPTLLLVWPLCVTLCLLWAIRLIQIKEEGQIRAWYVKLCVGHTAHARYMWLPDGETLLIAQSDEHYWLLFTQTMTDAGRGDRFPFNVIIGRYPKLRQISLRQDWQWLERLWRQHGIEIEPRTGEVSPDRPAGEYAEGLRAFFGWVLPRCSGFPGYEFGMSQGLQRWGKRKAVQNGYQRALALIPEESRSFQGLRETIRKRLADCG